MKLFFIILYLFTFTNKSVYALNNKSIDSNFVISHDCYWRNTFQYQNIGKWKYQGSDFPKSTFEIKTKGSEYICIVTFLKDGSSLTEKLTKISGQRYKVIKSKTGEYYKINAINGHLEMWDQDGLFIIAQKIK